MNYLMMIIMVLALAGCAAKESRQPASPSVDEPLQWIDGSSLTVEGRGWPDEPAATPYSRLPLRAQTMVTEAVWNLSDHAAGVTVRFETDAKEVWADWPGGGAMYHMPRNAVSGLDIYLWEEGAWQWAAIGRPEESRTTRQVISFPEAQPDSFRQYMVFLPSYQSAEYLRLGAPLESSIRPAPPRERQPVVIYGTSITQGGCSSRAGMGHAMILARRFDREIINLGFSGAGKMEMEMAELLGEIDAELYLLECLPNMTVDHVRERAEPFIRRLRELRPRTPIVLAEHLLLPPEDERNMLLRDLYNRLSNEWGAEANLHYLSNDSMAMLPQDENGTVDGVHPTDYGFVHMANYYKQEIGPLLR